MVPHDFGDSWIRHWPSTLEALDWYASLLLEAGSIEVYDLSEKSTSSSRGDHGYTPLTHSPKSLTLLGVQELAAGKVEPITVGLIKTGI
jgi:hypothetical protein